MTPQRVIKFIFELRSISFHAQKLMKKDAGLSAHSFFKEFTPFLQVGTH
jgi:hypothetical protein